MRGGGNRFSCTQYNRGVKGPIAPNHCFGSAHSPPTIQAPENSLGGTALAFSKPPELTSKTAIRAEATHGTGHPEGSVHRRAQGPIQRREADREGASKDDQGDQAP